MSRSAMSFQGCSICTTCSCLDRQVNLVGRPKELQEPKELQVLQVMKGWSCAKFGRSTWDLFLIVGRGLYPAGESPECRGYEAMLALALFVIFSVLNTTLKQACHLYLGNEYPHDFDSAWTGWRRLRLLVTQCNHTQGSFSLNHPDKGEGMELFMHTQDPKMRFAMS